MHDISVPAARQSSSLARNCSRSLARLRSGPTSGPRPPSSGIGSVSSVIEIPNHLRNRPSVTLKAMLQIWSQFSARTIIFCKRPLEECFLPNYYSRLSKQLLVHFRDTVCFSLQLGFDWTCTIWIAMLLIDSHPPNNSVQSFTWKLIAAYESNYGRSKTKCLLES